MDRERVVASIVALFLIIAIRIKRSEIYKALFTRREGYPNKRVTLASGRVTLARTHFFFVVFTRQPGLPG